MHIVSNQLHIYPRKCSATLGTRPTSYLLKRILQIYSQLSLKGFCHNQHNLSKTVQKSKHAITKNLLIEKMRVPTVQHDLCGCVVTPIVLPSPVAFVV
jgi:hypothetical protein